MSPLVRLVGYFALGLAMIAGAIGLDQYIKRMPGAAAEGIIVSARVHGVRPVSTHVVLMRTDGVKLGVEVDGQDARFTTGQRISIQMQGNIVRHCRFVSPDGRELSRYDDRPLSPVLLFAPGGFILMWLGFRRFQQDRAATVT